MGMFSANSQNDLTSAANNGRKKRPFGVKQVAMMKKKNDPHMKEKQFEVVCIVNESEGSRVRITLDNGQYFVLKIPQEFDGRFHEITANEKFNLETKFSYCDDEVNEPAITYESALAKGNVLILLYSFAQAMSRWEMFSSFGLVGSSLDFYLCCGTTTVLYIVYLIARSRVGSGGAGGRRIQVTLRSVERRSRSNGARKNGSTSTTSTANGSATTNGGTTVREGSAPSGSSQGSNKLPPPGQRPANKWPVIDPFTPTASKVPNAAGVHTLPPVDTWCHSPILIRSAITAPTKIDGVPCTTFSQFRINNIPIPFETKLFKGVAMIRLANLPDSPSNYFSGRNRKCQVAIQGQFKKRTRFDKCFSGQEFYQKIPGLPSKRVVDTVFSLLSSKLPPTFQQDVFADTPFFLSPLVNTVQGFAVESPENKQDVYGTEESRFTIEENTDLLGPEVPKDGEKRRKYFAVSENLEKYHFEPNLVYTFDYYQHFLDIPSLKFVVTSFLKFDISGIVGPQPLQLSMAKSMDGDGYFWNFEIWHKKLLEFHKEDVRKRRESEASEGDGE